MDGINAWSNLQGWDQCESICFNGVERQVGSARIRFGDAATAVYARFWLEDGLHELSILHSRWSLVRQAIVTIDDEPVHVVPDATYGQTGMQEVWAQYDLRGPMLGKMGDCSLSIKFLAKIE